MLLTATVVASELTPKKSTVLSTSLGEVELPSSHLRIIGEADLPESSSNELSAIKRKPAHSYVTEATADEALPTSATPVTAEVLTGMAVKYVKHPTATSSVSPNAPVPSTTTTESVSPETYTTTTSTTVPETPPQSSTSTAEKRYSAFRSSSGNSVDYVAEPGDSNTTLAPEETAAPSEPAPMLQSTANRSSSPDGALPNQQKMQPVIWPGLETLSGQNGPHWSTTASSPTQNTSPVRQIPARTTYYNREGGLLGQMLPLGRSMMGASLVPVAAAHRTAVRQPRGMWPDAPSGIRRWPNYDFTGLGMRL